MQGQAKACYSVYFFAITEKFTRMRQFYYLTSLSVAIISSVAYDSYNMSPFYDHAVLTCLLLVMILESLKYGVGFPPISIFHGAKIIVDPKS